MPCCDGKEKKKVIRSLLIIRCALSMVIHARDRLDRGFLMESDFRAEVLLFLLGHHLRESLGRVDPRGS